MTISTLGIDIGKNTFHLFGIDRQGNKVIKKRLNRRSLADFMTNLTPCLIAMEACGGAHHLARMFKACGHEVKLIAPSFVKPYVKSNKNDYNDAEAIAEAATRPGMRFVRIKTEEQQSWQLLHRCRQQAVQQRTALTNQIRGALLEWGITVVQGVAKLRCQLPLILEDADNGLPLLTRNLLHGLYETLLLLDKRISAYDAQIQELADQDEICQRLLTIPGIGSQTASALKAAVGDPQQFSSGRQMVAWLGLVPKQHSTGGRPRLSGISKRGDRYLRMLLVHGARTILHRFKNENDRCKKWVIQLNERSHHNIAAVGLANKLVRIAWAVMVSGASYRTT